MTHFDPRAVGWLMQNVNLKHLFLAHFSAPNSLRDETVEKFKAGLGDKTISQAWNISWSTLLQHTIAYNSTAQLQTNQDTAIHLN